MNMHPPLPTWRLILASASPRRRQLLQGLDLPVELTRADVDETPPDNVPLEQIAEILAIRKADAWQGSLAPDQVLITADTTVILGDLLLNKPEDDADAQRMLDLLSGNEHVVATGVCMRTASGTYSFTDLARVRFKRMSAEEIAYYVARWQPLDRAGAYGVQDWIGYTAVESINGSFYTVMGLPLHRIHTALGTIPFPPQGN